MERVVRRSYSIPLKSVGIISIDFAEGLTITWVTPGTLVTYIKAENLSYFGVTKPHRYLKKGYIQINQLPVTMGWH